MDKTFTLDHTSKIINTSIDYKLHKEIKLIQENLCKIKLIKKDNDLYIVKQKDNDKQDSKQL
jgi:hypothetical protein